MNEYEPPVDTQDLDLVLGIPRWALYVGTLGIAGLSLLGIWAAYSAVDFRAVKRRRAR